MNTFSKSLQVLSYFNENFLSSLLPKETADNIEHDLKPLVFKLDLVSEDIDSSENFNFGHE